MKLTSLQKSCLDVLIELFPVGTLYSDKEFYSSKFASRFSGDKFDELAEVCQSLERLNLICDLKIGSTFIVENLVIMHEGRYYKEYQRLIRREVWSQRAIGFVTGAITACIPWVLSLLKQPR